MLRKPRASSSASPLFSSLKSSIKPLLGMQCYVDAKNEDGIDVSSIFSGILVELGAQIAPSFGESCQVLVYSNGESKRLKAAAVFDVPVVSTLWVEQCRESNSKASVDDFLITAATASISNVKENKVVEPIIDQVSKLRNIDSPFFSSSQRVEDNEKSKQEKVKRQPLKNVSNNIGNAKMPVIAEEKQRKRPFIALVDSDDDDDDQDSPVSAPSIPAITDESDKKAEETYDSAVNDPFSSLRPTNLLVKTKKNDKKPVDRGTVDRGTVDRGTVDRGTKPADRGTKPADRGTKPADRGTKPADPSSKTVEKCETKKKSNTKHSAISRNNNIAVAVSGFDNSINDGEKETLQYILQEFLATINTSKKSDKGYVKASYIDNQNSKVDAYCSHIIAHSLSSKRSLRILFALANGSPIVTESWLYSCIEKAQWLPVSSEYRHARYKQHRADGQRLSLFENCCIFIGESINPTVSVLEKLIKLIGGSVTRSIDDAKYVLFSDSKVAANWLKCNALDSRKLRGNKECLVVNTKYIFDCIESNEVLNTNNREYEVELDFSEYDALIDADAAVGNKKKVKKTDAKPSSSAVVGTPIVADHSIKTKGKRKLPVSDSLTDSQSSKKKSPVSDVVRESNSKNNSQKSDLKKATPPLNMSSKKDSPPLDHEESPQLLLPKKNTPGSNRSKQLRETYKDDDDEVWSESDDIRVPVSTKYVPSQESFNYTAKSDTEDNDREVSPAW